MIRVDALSRSWGRFALRDISLHVDRGEYLVILGPCGSGKTLLLETIAGLHLPDAGAIHFGDRDVTDASPERRRVGLVYQQCALFPHLSIRKNISYGLRYRGLSRVEQDKRVEEMIDLLQIHDLAARHTPSELSGGEAQKVALARALAVEPEVLLLDEPLGSLDYGARGQVTDMLQEISSETQVPVIHVTHDYTEAASLASHLVVMRNGAVVQTGPVRDVFWRPESRFVADFLGVENVLDAECARASSTAEVMVGNLRIVADATDLSGPVSICVRPEDVRVDTNDLAGPNVFTGAVRQAIDRGLAVRLHVAIGDIEVTAVMPKRAFIATGMTAGSKVFVQLPPDDIHLMVRAPEAINAH